MFDEDIEKLRKTEMNNTTTGLKNKLEETITD